MARLGGCLAFAMALICCITPALAWKRAKGTAYPAVGECPNSESLCVFVSCPAPGQPSFELMLYEHGLNEGDPLLLRVDAQTFTLNLPAPGSNELYRWPLDPSLAEALVTARSASIRTDRGMRPFAISLRGAPREIGGLLKTFGPGPAASAPSGTPGASAAMAPPAPELAPAATAPPEAGGPSARSGRFLSDVIRDARYGRTYKALTDEGGQTWLGRSESRVELPSETETIDGRTFERFNVCMPHACDEFAAEVLFPVDGGAAVAAVRDRDRAVLLGHPPPPLAARLARTYKDLPVSAPVVGVAARAGAGPSGPVSEAASPLPAAAPFVRSITGLSDDRGCAVAETVGIVVSRQLTRGDRQVEGFDFRDQYGTGYVNVSLPERMNGSRKAELHARLLGILTPGARLRVKMKGCGASGSVQVLDAVAPAT